MKTYYRKQLPHIHPVGAIFFITTRLHGSLPTAVMNQLKQEHQEAVNIIYQESPLNYKAELYNAGKRYFKRFDEVLDNSDTGSHHFRDPKIAEILKKHLHRFDGERYDLLAYTIMSNHIHIVFDTRVQVERIEKDGWVTEENYDQVPEIMRMIKGASAYEINQYLGRKGTFWQKESYDHFVRSRREFGNIVAYILNNPVKAGICENWEDFPHNYRSPLIY